jgi:D-sedoheptulose 7-phosphate isomerase
MNSDNLQNFLTSFALQNIEAISHTSQDSQISRVLDAGMRLSTVLRNGGLIVSAGNGGSMADAMHLAEELSGKYRNPRPALRAVSLSDPTYLTCVGNDFGYNKVFVRGCEALLREGDAAVLYSTSGTSANVLEAAKYCKEIEVLSIGITGRRDSELEALVDVCLVPTTDLPTEQAQLVHTLWTHMLIEVIEKTLFDGE